MPLNLAPNLFYDALSGEFQPPTDPKGRIHTLARLAVGAGQRGEAVAQQASLYRYTPSWAVGSYAVAEWVSSNKLLGLSLEVGEPAVSTWADFQLVQAGHKLSQPELLMSDSTGVEALNPLELGPGLNDLRAQAAGVAQAFYDRLHDSSRS